MNSIRLKAIDLKKGYLYKDTHRPMLVK